MLSVGYSWLVPTSVGTDCVYWCYYDCYDMYLIGWSTNSHGFLIKSSSCFSYSRYVIPVIKHAIFTFFSADTLPSSVPQILINREPLQYIQGFDVRLLGYSDTVVTELCKRLGGDWQDYVGVTDSEGNINRSLEICVWFILSATSISSPKERVHLFDGGLWNVPSSSSEEEARKTKIDEEKESCKEIQSGRERSWDLKELDNLVPSTKIHKPDRTCDNEI